MEGQRKILGWPARRGLILAAAALLLLASCSPRKVLGIPMRDIPERKADWERGWSPDWVLLSAEEQQLDEYLSGAVLVWERPEGEGRRVRTEAVTQHLNLYWATEELFEGDRLVARGGLEFSPEGEPWFRNMVYLGEVDPQQPANDEILYYQLELFRGAKAACLYRSRTDFIGFLDEEDRLGRIPEDTVLEKGEGCPGLEELAATEFP
jgi:hypothetical protein